jgi:hypothetical protein
MEQAIRGLQDLRADLEKQQLRTKDIDLGPQIAKVQKIMDGISAELHPTPTVKKSGG